MIQINRYVYIILNINSIVKFFLFTVTEPSNFFSSLFTLIIFDFDFFSFMCINLQNIGHRNEGESTHEKKFSSQTHAAHRFSKFQDARY